MKFIKQGLSDEVIVDNVFHVSRLAKEAIVKYGEEKVVNATIGALFDEDLKLVAYDSVFNTYDNLPNQNKAQYANSFAGNQEFIQSLNEWLFNNTSMKLPYKALATTGGSGAISLSLLNMLDEDDIVLAPNIAWGSYKLMAEQFKLQYQTYNLIKGDDFDLTYFKECVNNALNQKNKIYIIINDPAHNPTGLSMGKENWDKIIEFLNTYVDKEIILMNDVAYIDYAFKDDAKDYMQSFNQANDNIMILMAYSLSKSFTFYGVRLGALYIINKNETNINSVYNVLEKGCRTIWSNVSNAGMVTFDKVMKESKEDYLKEKDKYVRLLEKRSSIFINEAKACSLDIYPYSDGFFITVKCDNNEIRDIWHEKLMENNIFTVKVNLGIRIGICAISIKKVEGLASKIKNCK